MDNDKKVKRIIVFLTILAVILIALGIRKIITREAEGGMPEEVRTITGDQQGNVPADITTLTPTVIEFEEIEDNIFIKGKNVKLRAEPSETAEIIATVPMSALYKRIGISETWSKIIYNKQECYVANQSITTQITN